MKINPALVSRWSAYFLAAGTDADLASVVAQLPDRCSLTITYSSIDHHDPDLAEVLLDEPDETIAAGHVALRTDLAAPPSIRIRIANLPLSTSVSIRSIRASHLHRMIRISGIVRKASEVRPRLTVGYYECLRCHSIMRVPQTSMYREDEPLECSKDDPNKYTGDIGCGRSAASTSFRLVERLSTYADTQEVEWQESPEGLSGGQQPQRIAVYMDGDICGIIQPGDRASAVGVLRLRPTGGKGGAENISDIYLDASTTSRHDDKDNTDLSDTDIADIRADASRPGALDRAIDMICPTICGYGEIKRALVLQQFGGVTRIQTDGTRLRGDSHILLLGEPGTAKSQLLRASVRVSPRGMMTSGRGASGAGLTASAVQTQGLMGSRWTLEAGALVLADQGLCAIDEIDKMSNEDRSSIHEALEQQTISVAKAGMNAVLMCRTAVIAAANPTDGRFNDTTPSLEQTKLDATLLSRFDAIFVIPDTPDQDRDAAISAHILLMRREKVGGVGDVERLRRWIAAGRTIDPVWTVEASERIHNYYLRQRAASTPESLLICARQEEALIRFAEAAARVRMSGRVEPQDADVSISVFGSWLSGVATYAGTLDIGAIETGMHGGRRAEMAALIGVIKDIEDRTGQPASREDIIEACKSSSVRAPAELLDTAHEKGLIVEKAGNRYRVISGA